MKKSYKGIRQYTDSFNRKAFDVVLIQWQEQSQHFEISTYDDISSPDVNYLQPSIFGLWAVNLASAKRKALMDSGLKSSDFDWVITEIKE